jgi:hypothetical protein
MEELYCKHAATFYVFEQINGIVSRIDKRWNQMTDFERKIALSPVILEKDINDPSDEELIMPSVVDECSDKCPKNQGE